MSTKRFKLEGRGKAVTLYEEFNISGQLSLVIRSEDGINQADLWWILKPYGSIRKIGVVKNEVLLKIPGGWFPPIIGSTLRCRCDAGKTVIYLSASETVDKSVIFEW